MTKDADAGWAGADRKPSSVTTITQATVRGGCIVALIVKCHAGWLREVIARIPSIRPPGWPSGTLTAVTTDVALLQPI